MPAAGPPATLDSIRDSLAALSREAGHDLLDERDRLARRIAGHTLSDIAVMTARAARTEGAAYLYAHAAKALAELDPVSALYAVATYALNPPGGIYGSGTGSVQDAYLEGVRVAASTALSALHAAANLPAPQES